MLDKIAKDFSRLEKKLKVSFKNKDLLLQAFTHRSFLNENQDFKLSHNERLEFLGDAVLEQAVTEYLFRKYPQKAEGELTSLRAALVNARILSEIAGEIGFNDFLLLSQGELKEEGKARQYILADTIEAFIGSLYLDKGMKECEKFIKKNIIIKLPKIIKSGLYRDTKSQFQEEAQEKLGITPCYKVLEERGPDHAKNFKVGAFLKKELIAEGEGFSKHEAEEKAAEESLKVKGW